MYEPADICENCQSPELTRQQVGGVQIVTYACGVNTDIPGQRIESTPACKHGVSLLSEVKRLERKIYNIASL